MLTLPEAQARIADGILPLASEDVAIEDAAGRVLAEDLVATEAIPRFDSSTMDGYALCAIDLGTEGPWQLPVDGEAAAGRPVGPLAAGAACRIFTGAPLPKGADAVVPQEDVHREGDRIRISRRPTPGQFVRRRGDDLPSGAVAQRAGARASPGLLALAAMLDRASLRVARRPRLDILCTGSELRAAGTQGPLGTIPESNSAALAALGRQAGATVRVLPVVPDDLSRIEEALTQALDTDVLVTVGGVSVGDYDFVRAALERAGVRIDFFRVAIKPGKPLVFGRRTSTRVLGLPGNPASALVTFALFGMPLLRALQGDARSQPSVLRVNLREGRARSSDRLELVRARLETDHGQVWAVADSNQASGAATSLARSDGLAFVPAGQDPIEAGAQVDFLRWVDA